MTAVTAAPPATRLPAVLRNPFGRGAAAVLVTMFLLTVVGTVADAPDLTSSGSFGAVVRLSIPILLAGLAALYAERAGVVNIGIEGMMVLGTFFAGWAGFEYGPWWGVVAGMFGGLLGGLLHALATVTFGVDHIVSGVAINLLGPGVARFLASLTFTAEAGGSASLGPTIPTTVGRFTFPFLAGGELFGWKTPDLFGWVDRQDWFFVSDVAAMFKGLTTNVSMLTILAIALVPLTAYVLWKTPFGLRLRSVGEKPSAADSLGVPVYRMKYVGVAVSGLLAGLSGAVLVLDSAGRFSEGQTVGYGFIGIACMIVGNWRPWGVLGAALLFGFPLALRLRSTESVLALVLLITILSLAAVLWLLVVRRKPVSSLAMLAVGLFFAWVYFIYGEVPQRLLGIAPYLLTLLVLALASQRLRMPAADGLRWRKGQTE